MRMEAAVYSSPNQLTLTTKDVPILAKGEILVQIKACGVCPSDLRILRYGHARVKPPQTLGHEIAGVIASSAPDVKEYVVGQKVVVTPKISCGSCFFCCRDEYSHCRNSRSIGYDLAGGFAEYLLIPAEGVKAGIFNVFGHDLSFPEAALTEPLACCLRAQRRAQIKEGTKRRNYWRGARGTASLSSCA